MTVLSRGDRVRRSGRRPGWLLLTVLLVLAIAASSALVFTNRVELLKLAVILSLWAAVVGAFVSAIYRRQSDADQAKVRDLKMVYNLQLDREISARREYELNVETHLRRELAAEMRAQSSDEVAVLRAELSALRTNLEILFDADLSHRPAIETDRNYAQWAAEATPPRPDRVVSSRVTAVVADEDAQTAESPIIDVPEEPLTPEAPFPEVGHPSHYQRPSDAEETRLIPPVVVETPPAAPEPAAHPGPRPAAPGGESSWSGMGTATPPPHWTPPKPEPGPPMFTPRNGQKAEQDQDPKRRGRHSSATELVPPTPPEPGARHRGADDAPVTGGQSVAELLARLQQSAPGEGGRRRRRQD